jgi:hypothetical protein
MEQPPLASSESRRGKAPSGVRKATTSSASPQRPLPIAARLLAAHTPDRKMTMNKMKWKLMLAVVFVASAFGGSAVVQSEPPWGPETPNFNLQVILGGEGFGLVKFRQPNDDDLVIYLDVWVRDLEPNTSYLLQRWTSSSTVSARARPGSPLAKDCFRSPSRRTQRGRARQNCFVASRPFPSARSSTSTFKSSRRKAARSC